MTADSHAQRKAKVYEAALTLIGRGVNPAAMTIQQLAEAAGIGKGTVYEYFSSKEEILQGLARYCFESENERIAQRFDRCHTLADLETELVAYLQEVAAQRMSSYKILADSFSHKGPMPDCTPDCRRHLTVITDTMLTRLQAAGEIDPTLPLSTCHTVMLCTVTGGLIALCFTGKAGQDAPAMQENLARDLRCTLHRSLQPQK